MGTVVRVLIAIVFAYGLLRVGLAALRMFAQPVAEPPRHCMEDMTLVTPADGP
jgi:hypothetical protein